MQKGVFTTWIKELCALVFVQTIQAFILAIVLSIILTFLDPSDGKLTSTDAVSALGILCIVLLTSLTKMEQITKKIFGLESGILQNKPPHGLLSSLVALKAMGRVLNNVPKMIGGFGSATFGAALDKKKARSNMIGKLNRRGLDTKSTPATGTPSTTGDNSLLSSDEYFEKAKQAKKDGNMDKYYENRGIAAGINKANKAAVATGNNGGKTASSDKDKEAYDKIMDEYNDALSKAKEKRKKGLETLAAGLNETIGAGIGGMAGFSIGAMTGLAQGDVDQMFKGAAYGMGVGDAAGEKLTKAVSSASTTMASRAKVNSKLDKQLAEMEKNLKINNHHRGSQAKRVRNITQKINSDLNNI